MLRSVDSVTETQFLIRVSRAGKLCHDMDWAVRYAVPDRLPLKRVSLSDEEKYLSRLLALLDVAYQVTLTLFGSELHVENSIGQGEKRPDPVEVLKLIVVQDSKLDL